jgi:hypothetical protein
MKKVSTIAIVLFLAVGFLSSCKAPHKCEAYSKVDVKIQHVNS